MTGYLKVELTNPRMFQKMFSMNSVQSENLKMVFGKSLAFLHFGLNMPWMEKMEHQLNMYLPVQMMI